MNEKKSEKVAILGPGSWGTALAKVLAENGHQVTIWSRSNTEEIIDEINQKHTNSRYLKNIDLPETIQATSNLEQVVAENNVLVVVIPTVGIRDLSRRLNELIETPKLIVHASKGLEQGTHHRISTIIEDEITKDKRSAIVALSGPSHAEEVAVQDLTSITSASENEEAAIRIQELFMNDYFRVYTNTDIMGVELGAALKNIIAIGAGALNGLGFGDNAIAALVTRGLAEITRLGIKLGADPITFMGLSGVGDLLVTCTSPHSRNWRAGKMFGEGSNLEEIQEEIGMAIEGLSTVVAARSLAQEVGVEMPITEAIYEVVYENVDVREAILNLMRREGRAE